ncbi:MAG: STAS/SEC14 domain-containing protein [Oricola sp.]
MIEFMDESTGKFVGIRASGKLTDADYKNILIPRVETLLGEHGKLDILFLFDEDFQGWDLHAAWDDMSFGMSHSAGFEKLAVVGGPAWVSRGIKALAFLLKGEVRTYPADKLEAAWEWIAG